MFAIILALSVASVDPELAALQKADARVAAVAWALQTANAPLCAETTALAGFSVQTLGQYQPEVRAAVAVQAGLGSRPGVQSVVPGGAADLAGLKAGDWLIRIDGVATPKDTAAPASYEAMAKTQALIEAGLRKPPLTLQIMRGKTRKLVAITGVAGCSSRVEIVTGESLNAQADGEYVQLSGALVEFAANDDDLATVIAHELAHNILHHRPDPETDEISRSIFWRLTRGGGKLRNAEYDADRLGVWLLARAGYDVDAVVPFWTRLAQYAEGNARSDGSHPGWIDRITRVAAAVTELKAQRTGGVPLVPTELPIEFPAQQSSSHAQFPR